MGPLCELLAIQLLKYHLWPWMPSACLCYWTVRFVEANRPQARFQCSQHGRVVWCRSTKHLKKALWPSVMGWENPSHYKPPIAMRLTVDFRNETWKEKCFGEWLRKCVVLFFAAAFWHSNSSMFQFYLFIYFLLQLQEKWEGKMQLIKNIVKIQQTS